MLLIKTKIAPSSISGMGLFANEFIPKGTVIWKFEGKVDVKLCKEVYQSLKAQYNFETMDKYIYKSRVSGCYILCSDDARFINHSREPNTLDTPEGDEGLTIAIKDIRPGEEITSDYEAFDADFDSYRHTLQ